MLRKDGYIKCHQMEDKCCRKSCFIDVFLPAFSPLQDASTISTLLSTAYSTQTHMLLILCSQESLSHLNQFASSQNLTQIFLWKFYHHRGGLPLFFSIVSVIFSLQEIKYSHLHPHLHFQFGSYLQLYP